MLGVRSRGALVREVLLAPAIACVVDIGRNSIPAKLFIHRRELQQVPASNAVVAADPHLDRARAPAPRGLAERVRGSLEIAWLDRVLPRVNRRPRATRVTAPCMIEVVGDAPTRPAPHQRVGTATE